MGKVEVVVAGAFVRRPAPGTHVLRPAEEVKPSCTPPGGGADSPGAWLCAAHPKVLLRNNLQKDIHVSQPGLHRLAWICATHEQVEVP